MAAIHLHGSGELFQRKTVKMALDDEDSDWAPSQKNSFTELCEENTTKRTDQQYSADIKHNNNKNLMALQEEKVNGTGRASPHKPFR